MDISNRVWLEELTHLVDEFDNFGGLPRKTTLFFVAIGTLRKDRALAADILKITTTDSVGLGAMALSRVLIEDYLHLRLLHSDPAKLSMRLADFEVHPHIDHYWTIEAMKEWGFEFGSSQDVKKMLHEIDQAFKSHGSRFLRKGRVKDSRIADDYYRTWTKLTLNQLISMSGLPQEGDKKSLRFMLDTYDQGSAIIHHNAFTIWFLATQKTEMMSKSYPSLAVDLSFIMLSKIMEIVIKIARAEEDNLSKYQSEEARLLDIMNKFGPI